jgi:hypothetical protein
MSITTPLTRSTTDLPAPATGRDRALDGPVELAELLAEVGTVVEALPADRLDARSTTLAALAAHLVDGAREAGVREARFTPSRDTGVTLTLRTLGRLAARTVGGRHHLDAARAGRIRDLTARIAA